MMKKTLWIGLCFSLALGGRVLAADAVIKQLKGKVTVKKQGSSLYKPAKSGDPIGFGDKILTKGGALAHIVFQGGATVLVKENSRVSILGTKKDTLISFDVGEFLIGLDRRVRGKKSLRVRTPAATAAVRGTLFWGLSDAKKDTTYACFTGSIAIEAHGKSIALEPGHTVKIPFGKTPADIQPADIPLSYLDTFAVDGSIQGLDDLLKHESEQTEH